ncbi:hypothetical protein UVI_02063480 [Ustilaginoidea virens]|uniref:Uncharacterized protein n=1 Tax=Ustilaginoidea virens TaxID=1159556 RepID=A0A1B5L1M1_USTVR|nr:hypothetical protein UVI_02063480 [Ustilaginoidea virens]
MTVPIFSKNAPMVEKLTVLSFNLRFGGTPVKNFHAKQVRFISDGGADTAGV